MPRHVVQPSEAPGDTIEVTHQHDRAPMGTIAMVMRDHIASATMTSLLQTDWSFVSAGRSVDRVFVQGNILTLNRNECVQRMDGDWILFIDDDMAWDADAVRRLIEIREYHDLDMVGGLCFRRTHPHQPTMFMRQQPDSGGYNYLEEWAADVVEVDATGMAFVLIHRRVFERIVGSPMPPIEARLQMPPTNFFRWEGGLGEDLRFCQDAKASGSRIWVDTRVKIRHVAEVQIGLRDFQMALATREPEVVDIRRQINDEMGLPTVTPERAREVLGWR